MVVLFVHGMGRSPLSGWPLLRRLRQAKMETQTFGYTATFQEFDFIVGRLKNRIEQLAAISEYVVVGHSLGGVLLRAALNSLPQGTALPRCVYLLGSPLLPSCLAMRFKENLIFRAIVGDCGQVLASPERMSAIGPLAMPTVGIAGIGGVISRYSPFGNEVNDGVVSVSEVSAPWLSSHLQVPVVHTFLPSSGLVARIIIHDIAQSLG
jgi:pimeloyl-ACP methyl ester carboxylesterase